MFAVCCCPSHIHLQPAFFSSATHWRAKSYSLDTCNMNQVRSLCVYHYWLLLLNRPFSFVSDGFLHQDIQKMRRRCCLAYQFGLDDGTLHQTWLLFQLINGATISLFGGVTSIKAFYKFVEEASGCGKGSGLQCAQYVQHSCVGKQFHYSLRPGPLLIFSIYYLGPKYKRAVSFYTNEIIAEK